MISLPVKWNSVIMVPHWTTACYVNAGPANFKKPASLEWAVPQSKEPEIFRQQPDVFWHPSFLSFLMLKFLQLYQIWWLWVGHPCLPQQTTFWWLLRKNRYLQGFSLLSHPIKGTSQTSSSGLCPFVLVCNVGWPTHIQVSVSSVWMSECNY